jgi:hypothetical protein
MAGIFKKLSPDTRSRNALRDLRLEFIRFRRFLENMREILNLIEDAGDKLREEYIYDRHYVLSLVDTILEEASMLTFNSSVLSPAAGKKIYAQLDAHKNYARKEFLESGGLSQNNLPLLSTYLDADPETQLLAAVLNWLIGPLPADHPAVMDFIRYVTDEVFENCRREELIEKVNGSAGNVPISDSCFMKLIDVHEVSLSKREGFVSHRDIKCRPFGMLLIGLQSGRSSGGTKEKSGINGWVLFDEEAVSLRICRGNDKIHLEAALHGDVASDFVFLYSQNPFDLRGALPQGSWVEKTGQGTLAWIYDVPTDHLEKQLVQLGSMLLG